MDERDGNGDAAPPFFFTQRTAEEGKNSAPSPSPYACVMIRSCTTPHVMYDAWCACVCM